jgi:cell division protein ZapA
VSHTNKVRTTVQIHGQRYTVVGKEPSSHIRMVASMVDDKMREIKGKNISLDTSQLAVLTALNIVSEHVKIKEEYEQLLKKLEKEEDNNA